MGQAQSDEHARHKVTTEQLNRELAHKFAKRCFTPLELFSFQDVFRSLEDHEGSLAYLKEETISRFLEIPDILGVSSIVFQMMSYLGAFPFAQDAPAVLGFEQMVMVVTIMTERYKTVLKKGSKDRITLFFRSLAVFDRHEGRGDSIDDPNTAALTSTVPEQTSKILGFAVDQAANDEDLDEDDEDGLALAALESLDAIEVFKQGDAPLRQASIPTDNLRKLIMLLLVIAPIDPQESLAKLAERLTGEELEGLRSTADNILSSFVDVEKSPGVKMHHFDSVIPISLPLMFNGLNALFEHFLFSKTVDFTRRRSSVSSRSSRDQKNPPPQQPLLRDEGEIMDLNVLSQLSFFIPGNALFRQLRLLYSGGEAGFSMGSFELKVFHWRAPTILLVSGNRISDPPVGGQERAYTETLPPKRFPDSSKSSRLVFGVYVHQPWRQTFKECFGDSDSRLFQLEPTHEVFHASSVNTDYVSFTKPPTAHTGIGIGNPHPKQKQSTGQTSTVPLGGVSLTLNGSFEFGVFTHHYTSGGGAFRISNSRRRDWQDRFEIESLEVWGCGGDEEAELQRQRWAWEEREAEARRRINLGTGDIDADRALLEMAGIISGDKSGGSMG